MMSSILSSIPTLPLISNMDNLHFYIFPSKDEVPFFSTGLAPPLGNTQSGLTERLISYTDPDTIQKRSAVEGVFKEAWEEILSDTRFDAEKLPPSGLVECLTRVTNQHLEQYCSEQRIQNILHVGGIRVVDISELQDSLISKGFEEIQEKVSEADQQTFAENYPNINLSVHHPTLDDRRVSILLPESSAFSAEDLNFLQTSAANIAESCRQRDHRGCFEPVLDRLTVDRQRPLSSTELMDSYIRYEFNQILNQNVRTQKGYRVGQIKSAVGMSSDEMDAIRARELSDSLTYLEMQGILALTRGDENLTVIS